MLNSSENQKDLESLSSSLQDAINDCEPNELKGLTPDDAMNKVENEVEKYIERINTMLKNKKRIIADAKGKSVLVIPTTVAPAVSSGQHCQQGDQFRDLSVLKPKYLEKETNLLEVKHWIQQAKNYIEAGYKDCPPEKGVYKYLLPLLHHTWAKSLDKTDPYNRTLHELTDSLENEE